MTDLTELNKDFYDNNKYSYDVRQFLKAFDTINKYKGTHVVDQLTCKENNNLNEYAICYLRILNVFDKYCEHFCTVPQFNKTAIGLPMFVQFYTEYSLDIPDTLNKINEELEFLDEYPFIELDIIYRKGNDYPNELIYPTNQKYLFGLINAHYEQEIYDLDDKYFDDDGMVLDWKDYRGTRGEIRDE